MRLRASVLMSVLFALCAVSLPARGQEPEAPQVSWEQTEALRLLSLSGGPADVPAAAALLGDAVQSHLARLALEAIPGPEASQALRDALATTSGALKAGVIGSIAVRRDLEAVPALAALLGDADPVVAQAAAAALARLATPEAADALKQALARTDLSPVTRAVFCDGLLGCADALAADGKKDAALALYDSLLDAADTPRTARCAALRGGALARGGADAVPRLAAAMKGEDRHLFEAALRAAREIGGGAKVTKALAALLPELPAERKAAFIQLLGERGDGAGPALLAEAKTAPADVQVAALRALTRIGHEPALDLVRDWLGSQDAALAAAAQESLKYFPGRGGDTILKDMLKDEDPAIRALAVKLVGAGGLEEPNAPLMKAAEADQDAAVRVAALGALRNIAGAKEMPGLLKRLTGAPTPEERAAAESALAALCARSQKVTADIVVTKAVYGALPDGPSADVTEIVARVVASGAPVVDASNGLFGDTAPGLVKRLQVECTVNGSPAVRTAAEGEQLTLAAATAPAEIADAFRAAYDGADGEPKAALLRLLATTGNAAALETLKAAAAQDGPLKDAALRSVCAWPTADALPAVMELAMASPDPAVKTQARRDAVRMLGLGQTGTAERLRLFGELLAAAADADEKKLVLSGLAQIPRVDALEMVLRQFPDEAVKSEAVQAAAAIAKNLGKTGREDAAILPAAGLAGWKGNTEYWRFEDGAAVGGSDKQIPRNEFLWAPVTVGDFYLALDMKLDPPSANAGIQFRSKPVDEAGQALGYQADAGQDVWGRLYHEHGRGKLDWSDRADAAVKPGEWNRYEILAVGPAIWLVINGKLGAACLDINKEGERSGGIAVQIHGGPPQTASYRFVKLVHDPAFSLLEMDPKRLFSALAVPEL